MITKKDRKFYNLNGYLIKKKFVNKFQQSELFKTSDLIEKRFIISDLQKSTFNLEEVEGISELNIIPTQVEKLENLSIKELSFNRPYHTQNSNEEVNFKIGKLLSTGETSGN